MSIRSELLRLVDEEVLWCVEPFPGDSAARTVLVSEAVIALLASTAPEKRVGQLLADLQDTVSGGDLIMSFTPFKHEKSTFGILDPEAECTWEYRSRDPSPGLRLFGRFPEIDTFVAIDWAPRSKPLKGFDREPLGDRYSNEYQFAQIEVENFWKRHLSAITPISGKCCSDYFSQQCTDAGAQW